MGIGASRIAVIARRLWLCLCVLALMATLYLYDGSERSNAELILLYAMYLLSFPVSLVLAAIVTLIAQFAYHNFGYVVHVSYVQLLATWLLLAGAGYLQWFALLPL